MHGSCHCGSINFEIKGKVHRFTNCHCPDCRKINGTAFSANLIADREGFSIASGSDVLVDYESSPGKIRCFCSRCGSHVYARMTARPGIVIVRAGLLDGDPGIRPQNHIWVSQKAPWYEITDSLPQFQEGYTG